MIQIILQGKSEMSPLKMLYFFAPVELNMSWVTALEMMADLFIFARA